MRHSVKDAALCVTRNVCAVCLSSGVSTCLVLQVSFVGQKCVISQKKYVIFCHAEICHFLSRRMPTQTSACRVAPLLSSFCKFFFGGLFCESIRLLCRNLHDAASCVTYRNVCVAVEHTEISALQLDTQKCVHCSGIHRNVCIAVGNTKTSALQWDTQKCGNCSGTNRNVCVSSSTSTGAENERLGWYVCVYVRVCICTHE